MNTFQDFPLSSTLKSNLARHGFVTPTPVQLQAIPPALSGQDVVATAQTGTGKTLAFVVPMLESLTSRKMMPGVNAVILSPTRELAIQIEETFAKVAQGTGIKSAIVVGGLNERSQLNSLRKGAQVVIATPGRLCDFLERNLVNLGAVRMLVLDEADRMLDMGFRPAIQMIMGAMKGERQTMFFSATIEPTVAHLIEKHLYNPVRISIGSTSKPAEEIDLHVYEVDQDRKMSLLHHMLKNEQGSFLVFARTKRGVDRLAKNLSRDGVKTACIHGDRSQNQRNQALKGFQDGDYRVLVATDVAARGIHVEGIAHVVNYDLPQAPEDFIHRVGRTGRAGSRGTASTFCARGEKNEISRIEKTIKMKLEKRATPADLAVAVKTAHTYEPDVQPRRSYSTAPKRAAAGFKSASGPSKRRFVKTTV